MSKKLIIVLTMVGIIGLGTYAFAHWGGGYGNQGWMHGGPGMHHGYFSGPGYGYPSDLKEEEFKSLKRNGLLLSSKPRNFVNLCIQKSLNSVVSC